MTDRVWELDGLRLQVTVPADSGAGDDQPPTEFLWASAIAKRASGATVVAADTVTPDGLTVLAVWGASDLTAGVWQIQVRAGASEATASTIYDKVVTLLPSIRLP